MVAAQVAPTGAKICTSAAIRTIGRKFFSRRRINQFLLPANQSCTESAVEFRFPTIPGTALFLAHVPQQFDRQGSPTDVRLAGATTGRAMPIISQTA